MGVRGCKPCVAVKTPPRVRRDGAGGGVGTDSGGLLLAGYRRSELEQYQDGGEVIARQDGFDLRMSRGDGVEGFHEGGTRVGAEGVIG